MADIRQIFIDHFNHQLQNSMFSFSRNNRYTYIHYNEIGDQDDDHITCPQILQNPQARSTFFSLALIWKLELESISTLKEC